MDFKLNEAGDIEHVNGNIVLLSTIQEAVRQRLDIQHKTFQGEHFLDTTFGVPYRQQIIGKGLSKAEVDALYITIINNDPDVLRIKYFKSDYNPLNRQYSLTYDVLTTDGNLRNSSPNLYPTDEIEYPEPDGFTLTPSCDLNFIDWVLTIHPILHEDLPQGGDSTWIYGNTFYPYALDFYLDRIASEVDNWRVVATLYSDAVQDDSGLYISDGSPLATTVDWDVTVNGVNQVTSGGYSEEQIVITSFSGVDGDTVGFPMQFVYTVFGETYTVDYFYPPTA